MKVRSGFVSNSSSSSFIISLDDFTTDIQKNILSLTDRTDDMSRCTGIVKDVNAYLKMYEGDEWNPLPSTTIREILKNHKNIVLIRESDEEMGGSFADRGVDIEEVKKKSLLEFEYH